MTALAYLVADHHAGGGYPNRGLDDSTFAMAQIVAAALVEKPDWLILLGDSLDQQKNRSRGVVPLLQQLHRVADAGISVGFIDGNHDFDCPPWLEAPYTLHLDQRIFALGSYNFMGVDFRNREAIQEFLANCIPPSPQIDGLLMHQCWADFMGSMAAPQCEFANIPMPIRFVATGDYHDRAVCKTFRGKDGQTIKVVNPGATSLQRITENPDKYYAVFDDAGEFQLRKLKSRPFIDAGRLGAVDDFVAFLEDLPRQLRVAEETAEQDGLPAELRRPILKVSYASTLEGAARRLTNAVGAQAHLFAAEYRVTDEGHSVVTVDAEQRTGEAFTPRNLLGHEFIHDPSDPLTEPVRNLAEALIDLPSRESVAEELTRWRVNQINDSESAKP